MAGERVHTNQHETLVACSEDCLLDAIKKSSVVDEDDFGSDIQSIDFVFFEDNCFSDTDGINVDASMEKLIELTESALREAFPGCGEIEVSSGQSGMRCQANVYMHGDYCPDSVVVAVEEIAASVWEKRGNDWIVYSDEDEDEDEEV
jgi:hypothetical protein